jgi:hypothetical protein
MRRDGAGKITLRFPRHFLFIAALHADRFVLEKLYRNGATAMTKNQDLSNKQFERDTIEYRTASDARRIELEKKWGARSDYFREAEAAGNDALTFLDIAY